MGDASSARVPELEVEVYTAGPPQPLPPCRYAFPDVSRVPAHGLACGGGDFEPATIVAAYRAGLFPWPHPDEELLWFSPDPRAVIEIGGLHVSRRLARTLRQGDFRFTVDWAFEAVMRACAEDRGDGGGTWITPALIEGYVALHRLGWAHSFEAWTDDGTLAGGAYGVGVGAMFGAESMFHRVTDASKAVLVAMTQHVARIGVQFVDIQVLTEHTARMGGVEIRRRDYLRRLRAALAAEARWV